MFKDCFNSAAVAYATATAASNLFTSHSVYKI